MWVIPSLIVEFDLRTLGTPWFFKNIYFEMENYELQGHCKALHTHRDTYFFSKSFEGTLQIQWPFTTFFSSFIKGQLNEKGKITKVYNVIIFYSMHCTALFSGWHFILAWFNWLWYPLHGTHPFSWRGSMVELNRGSRTRPENQSNWPSYTEIVLQL